MAEGYAKLLSSIIRSSIWREPDSVIRVWVTMLALADKDGCVWASLDGLAHAARKTEGETAEALRVFLEPDPRSRSKELDGRRVVEIDGGWQLVNYCKIRDLYKTEVRKEGKRNWWAENRGKGKMSSVSRESSFDPPDQRQISTRSDQKREKNLPTEDEKKPGFALEPPTVKSKSRKTAPPEDFEPNQTTLAWANRLGEQWRPHWQNCSDWARSNGKLKADWQATLRNWISGSQGKYPIPKAQEKYVAPVDPKQPPFAPGPVHAFTTEEDRQAERIRRGLV